MDPSHELGRARTADFPYELAVHGNALLCVDGSNPYSPGPPVALPLAGTASGVALAGDLALGAASQAGLVLVDISDVASPRQLRLPDFYGLLGMKATR